MLDYRDAVAGGRCFADPELASGKPRLDKLGLPWPTTGGYASVYQLNATGRSWAVRCFVRSLDPSTARRCAAISSHLNSVQLSYTTDFEYLPEGMEVLGGVYPIVKMPWIEGSNLNAFVEDLVIAGDRDGLAVLGRRWREMLRVLETNQIAHGDLSHGNVRVEPSGMLRLIDYDGMWVPPLAGMPPTQGGHPSYQHPRRGTAFDGLLDRFPGLVIACALDALAADTSLWDRYDNGDNLLFTKADLTNPSRSSLVDDLYAQSDIGVVTLVDVIVRAVSGSYDAVPRLGDVALLASRPQHRAGAYSFRRSGGDVSQSPDNIGRIPSWVQAHLDPRNQIECSATAIQLTLAAVWSRPGVSVRHWVEDQPVYGNQTVMVPREIKTGFLWRRTQVIHEPVQKRVQIGTRPVPRSAETPIAGPTAAIAGVAFAGANGKCFAAATATGQLWVWTSDSNEAISMRQLGAGGITGLAALGDRLVTSSTDKTLVVWGILGAAAEQILRNDSGSLFYHVAVSSDRRLVAGALGQKAVRVFDLAAPGANFDLRGHRRKVRAVSFASPATLISGSDDATVRVWDIASRKMRSELTDHLDAVTAVAGCPNGHLIASGGMDGFVIAYEVGPGSPARVVRYNTGFPVHALVFGSDQRHLFVGCDSDIRVLDCVSGRVVRTLSGHAYEVLALAAGPNGSLLSGDAAGLVVYWTSDERWSPIELNKVNPGLTPTWPAARRAPSARVVSSGTAPTCPNCHIAFVRRSQNVAPYRPFWGCPNYPRCRRTRNIG